MLFRAAWIRSNHWQALLHELVDAGKIKARSKWRQVYPTFASDERYLNLLGKPGSNPLELFWDLVDQIDQRLDAKITAAEECIRRVEVPNESPEVAAKVAVVTAQSTLEEFVKRVRRDPESGRKLNEEDLQEVFRSVRTFNSTCFCHSAILQLHDQAVKKQQDEKRRYERKQRHLQDDLRYALKKLPDPIDISMSYDAVRLTSYLYMFLFNPYNPTNISRLFPSLNIWQSTRPLRTKKVVVLPLLSLRRDKKSAFGKPHQKTAHLPQAGNARNLPVTLTGIVNANASVSETGTESAIVTRTATRDGTTNVIETVSATGIVVIVIARGTGTCAVLGTITV